MKIQGGNGAGPVDLAQVKAKKEAEASKESKKVANDSVDAKLSKTLSSLTEQIANSGLTAGELHSNIDEDRLQKVLDSIDRVDGKQPRVSDDQLLEIADRIADRILAEPQRAVAAYGSVNASRAAELLAE